MAELLATVMPDSDAGKLGTFLILTFLVLTVTGRFKLEWIGTSSRHVFRWLRCKIRDKHHWKQEGDLFTCRNEYGEAVAVCTPVICGICGKEDVKEDPVR